MNQPETPLTLTERVRATLELGESHFREFKSAFAGPSSAKAPRDPKSIRKDIGEALVAFANADGGELLVGVEDDGRVTGVPHGEEVVDTLMEAARTHVHGKTRRSMRVFNDEAARSVKVNATIESGAAPSASSAATR